MGRRSISTGSSSHIHYQLLWEMADIDKSFPGRCSVSQVRQVMKETRQQNGSKECKTVNYTGRETAKSLMGLYNPLKGIQDHMETARDSSMPRPGQRNTANKILIFYVPSYQSTYSTEINAVV